MKVNTFVKIMLIKIEYSKIKIDDYWEGYTLNESWMGQISVH
jgi:hypothetical protein